ncbi:MAG: LysR family transcriptional regulator [Paracoccaceae bacterium]
MCRTAIVAIEAAEAELFGGRTGAPKFTLNLRTAHLNAIEAVTRDGSVTIAAKRLGRSQPDLSRTLSDFSKRFGIELFQRATAGMRPLPPAQALTALCGTLSYLQDRLAEQLHQLEGDIVGRVSIGMLPFSGQDLVSRAFARLTNRHPNVRLTCVTGSYLGLVEALRRREIDRIVGIQRQDACPEGIAEAFLFDEWFTVVARADHPIQTTGRDVDVLAATNWIVAPHGTPVRAHFETVFSGLDATPPTQTCEMLSFAAAEQMLVESHSVAMLTYSKRKLGSLRPELKVVETLFPDTSAPIGMSKLRDAPDDPALAEFEAILKELVASGA